MSDGVTITQVPLPSGKATLNDVYQMHAYAKSGKSGRQYIYDNCPYARRQNGTLQMLLPFHVWSSPNSGPGLVSTNNGEISAGTIFSKDFNADVIFDKSKTAKMPFPFYGNLVKEMPFFNSLGVEIDPTITRNGQTVTLSEPATGVLRASGKIIGQEYYVRVTVENITAADIDKLATTVTAKWSGGSTSLDLEIPQCVTDIMCDGFLELFTLNDDTHKRYKVYYSVCDGSILKEGWEESDYPGALTQEEELAIFDERNGGNSSSTFAAHSAGSGEK